MIKKPFLPVTRFLKHQFFSFQSDSNVSLLTRASAELDDSVAKELNDGMKPRRHPGIRFQKPVSLPDLIKKSISKLLSEDAPRKQLMKETKLFKNYLASRMVPLEKSEYYEKQSDVRNKVEQTMDISFDNMTEDELERLNKMVDSKVGNILKKEIYSWNRINFTKYMSKLYLVTRAAAEYGVLYTIFKDLENRANFTPKTVFDFGSGMGSVIWAAHSIWGKSIREYYCVDSSSHANDLSEEIIKDSGEGLTKRVFYRQFLPASYDISSDLVVSSYSLMELSSQEQRLEVITNLWRRTNKFLVLIEYGNKSGFKVLNEARMHILSEMNISKENSFIFAPCPHDKSCPRAETKCFFEASYHCFPQRPETLKKEHYSYIVFQKGARNEDKQWPRIVQPVLCRSRHVICRVCCISGDLKEVIVTPSKNGKLAYRCAKASKWGDLFPYNLKPYDNRKGNESEADT